MKKYIMLIICIVLAATVVLNNRPAVAPPPVTGDVPGEPDTNETPAELEPEPEPIVKVDNANELGRVPVLMYHRIVESEGDWARSIENFRQDLEDLYHRGYTLVNLSSFYDGTAIVPPGRSPVILTFDDSTRGQFNYLLDEASIRYIDPDCAVGILLAAQAKWPELGLAGTFFLNQNPFGQNLYWQDKLRHLVELGFEIGNHTYSHPKFNQLTDAQVREDIVKLQLLVWEAVPGYEIRSLALPFGIAPRDRSVAVAGTHDGVSYRHDYILEVGAEPAFAPNHIRHNPLSLPRIAATDELLDKWLGWLDGPLRRYISDGQPDVFTYPEELKEQIKKAP